MTIWEKMCHSWKEYYISMAANRPIYGELIPVAYGPKMTEVLKQLAGDKEFEPKPFKSTERTPEADEDIALAEKTIQQVKTVWDAFGLEFPDVEYM